MLKKWALNQATKGLGGPLVSRVDLWMMTLVPQAFQCQLEVQMYFSYSILVSVGSELT